MQSVSQIQNSTGIHSPFLNSWNNLTLQNFEGCYSGSNTHIPPNLLHSLYPSIASTMLNLYHTNTKVHIDTNSKRKSFTIDAILGKEENHRSSDNTNQHMEGLQSQRHDDENKLLYEAHWQNEQNSYFSNFSCHPVFSFRHQNVLNQSVKEKFEKKPRPCLTSTNDWKNGKSKRVRTIFTPEQLERLEAEFERQQYMVGTERYYLAASLNLSEAQVKVWFQNRRIKWRKQNLEQQHARLAKFDLLTGGQSTPSTDHLMEDDDYLETDSEAEDENISSQCYSSNESLVE